MADLIRVTLEEPYVHSATGILRMRYGTTDAIMPDEMNAEEYVIDMRTRQPRIIPGSPIVYELNYNVEDLRSVMMPEDAAFHFFGNYNIKDPAAPDTNIEMTKGFEKRRLTALWGDYIKRPANAAVPQDWKRLQPIAPPVVPRVLVEKISQNTLKPLEGFAYRPWDFYRWQDDCVDNIWDRSGRVIDQLQPQQQPVPALIGAGFTAEQIQKFISEAVAEKIAESAKATKERQKASA